MNRRFDFLPNPRCFLVNHTPYGRPFASGSTGADHGRSRSTLAGLEPETECSRLLMLRIRDLLSGARPFSAASPLVLGPFCRRALLRLCRKSEVARRCFIFDGDGGGWMAADAAVETTGLTGGGLRGAARNGGVQSLVVSDFVRLTGLGGGGGGGGGDDDIVAADPLSTLSDWDGDGGLFDLGAADGGGGAGVSPPDGGSNAHFPPPLPAAVVDCGEDRGLRVDAGLCRRPGVVGLRLPSGWGRSCGTGTVMRPSPVAWTGSSASPACPSSLPASTLAATTDAGTLRLWAVERSLGVGVLAMMASTRAVRAIQAFSAASPCFRFGSGEPVALLAFR